MGMSAILKLLAGRPRILYIAVTSEREQLLQPQLQEKGLEDIRHEICFVEAIMPDSKTEKTIDRKTACG